MANEEHVKLIQQGVEAWNEWRGGNIGNMMPELEVLTADHGRLDLRGANFVRADLSGENLREANLSGANLILSDLSGANLTEANLSGTNFSGANLRGTNLRGADLSEANLIRADLSGAILSEADLRGAFLSEAYVRGYQRDGHPTADLSGANLSGATLNRADIRGVDLSATNISAANLSAADLSGANLSTANVSGSHLDAANLSEANLTAANLSAADLSGANLSGANLSWAQFSRADLSGAVLSQAIMDFSTFGNNDLSTTKALETVRHSGPSTIGTDTLLRSVGKLPEIFLRGCGLSDWEIEASKLHLADLTNEEIGDALYRIHDLRAHQAIQISPLFISYSHADDPFVNKMEHYLVKSGIRFWRDVHHATAGPLEKQIDRAIRLNPTVLVVLSKDSVQSDWVEHEVRLARKLAKEIKRDVLCPVALDESWKSCDWPHRLREQVMEFNILDFSAWQNVSYFERMYRRLIDGLNLYYTKPE